MRMLVQVAETDQAKFGIKRTCRSCGVCFYDLDKHPSECTNCGAIYELHVNTRSRRSAVAVEDFADNVSFLDLDHDVETLPDADAALIEDDNPFDVMLDDE